MRKRWKSRLAGGVAALASSLIVTLVALGGPARPAQAEEPAPGETKSEGEAPGVDLVWGLKIPLRDGIALNGTVYKPAGQREPLPVVATITPYIGDTYHARALYFARHGYVFVLVDARGRGSSGGRFHPFAQEADDGYDAVELLARQPWSNGKVALWGGSYGGYEQWATLKAGPPHLATAVPTASVHPGYDFPLAGGILPTYAIQWLTYTAGATNNRNLFGEFSYWNPKFLDLYRRQARFDGLDSLVGNPSPVFQEWLAHPAYDAYWQAMSPTPAEYRRIAAPLLTITGHYDADQPGALSYYREHMRHGDPAVAARHYLVIGPWDHQGTRTPSKDVGGIEFGEASMVDMNALHRAWYDWTMKGGPKPEFLKKRVAYYVAGDGAEVWKYADDLDSIAPERRKLYLAPPASAPNGEDGSDVFHSGTLAAEPRPEMRSDPPERWTYDPKDLRHGELEAREVPSFAIDQTSALHLFGAGVVYHSEPFAEAMEIDGQVKLSLWLSLDVPDTDLAANLYEIRPDGTSVLLTYDQLRARYRESLSEEHLVVPGAIQRYDLVRFPWFARRIGKGSRLRLVVQSLNSSQWEKNYGTGKKVAEESGADARVAHIALYHDAEHPSVLELPIAH